MRTEIFAILVSIVIAGPPTRIRFLSNSALSAVTSMGQPFSNDQNFPIYPGIILQIVDDDGALTNVNGLFVEATSSCVTLSGNKLNVTHGFANFTDLAAQTCPSSPCPVTFIVYGSGSYPVLGQSIATGPFTVRPLPNFAVRFTRESSIGEGEDQSAVVGIPLQPILIKLVDSCGNNDNTSTGQITITASSFPDNVPLTNNQTFFTDGEAVFSRLTYTQVPTSPSTLRFNVTSGGLAAGKFLSSGNVTVTMSATPNFNVKFSPLDSTFTAAGQGDSITIGTKFSPILIQMVDSANRFDNSSSDVVITMTGGTNVTGRTAVRMQSGVANFSDISFGSCQPGGEVFLTFTAGSQGQTVAAGKSVLTGRVTVTGVGNFGIDFAPYESFFNASGQQKSMEVGKKIPRIMVLIKDSCFNLDPTGNNTMVQLSDGYNSGGPLRGNLTVKVLGGRAVFSDLIIDPSAPEDYTPKFTFTAIAGLYPVNGKMAITGPITVLRPSGSPANAPTPPAPSTSVPIAVPGVIIAVFTVLVILIGVFVLLRRRGFRLLLVKVNPVFTEREMLVVDQNMVVDQNTPVGTPVGEFTLS